MPKIKPVAEVHYSANAGGYYVLNRRYRMNRACTHLFASREDALAFANTAALLGWRQALSQLAAALTAPVNINPLTTVKEDRVVARDVHTAGHVPVKRETPPDDDLLDAFGTEAVLNAKRSRLELLLSTETRPQWRRHYTRQLRKLEGKE